MRPTALVAAVMAAALGGCSKGHGDRVAVYPAAGQVLWQGKPLAGAIVISFRKVPRRKKVFPGPRGTRTLTVGFV